MTFLSLKQVQRDPICQILPTKIGGGFVVLAVFYKSDYLRIFIKDDMIKVQFSMPFSELPVNLAPDQIYRIRILRLQLWNLDCKGWGESIDLSQAEPSLRITGQYMHMFKIIMLQICRKSLSIIGIRWNTKIKVKTIIIFLNSD